MSGKPEDTSLFTASAEELILMFRTSEPRWIGGSRSMLLRPKARPVPPAEALGIHAVELGRADSGPREHRRCDHSHAPRFLTPSFSIPRDHAGPSDPGVIRLKFGDSNVPVFSGRAAQAVERSAQDLPRVMGNTAARRSITPPRGRPGGGGTVFSRS